MKRVSLFLCLLISAYYAKANNISVQKVAIVDTNRAAKTASIRFSISWENSWRDSVNWDAAWIFIKFREPKDSVWRYRHLTMSNTGNSVGIGSAAMKFAFPDDRKGVFFYRQGISSGKVTMDSVKLFWNYGADSVRAIDSVEVKIFATEMVYVPAGNFCLGDGNGKTRSYSSFQLKNAQNNFVTITEKWSPLVNTFVNINNSGPDDALLANDGVRISGLSGLDMNGDKIAEFPDFPTGYRSFYCMKYEISQGQYADFLNTLSLRDSAFSPYQFYVDTTKLKKVNPRYKLALQTLDPLFGYTPPDLQRHTILLDSAEAKYTVSRPDRAFGKGSYNTYLSFCDWSAMRPISELEFEKACRGPLPPSYKTYNSSIYNNYNDSVTTNWEGGEWAWGNDTSILRISNSTITGQAQPLIYSGIENGTETFTNYSIIRRYNNPITAFDGGTVFNNSNTYSGGDKGNGPFRVGIFANDTSSRISSGASYYGIMDFSKNVSQLAANVGSAVSRGLSYKKNGDGYLNALGNPDNTEFLPLYNVGPMPMNVMFIAKSGAISERSSGGGNVGFRTVRSAPSDN